MQILAGIKASAGLLANPSYALLSDFVRRRGVKFFGFQIAHSHRKS